MKTVSPRAPTEGAVSLNSIRTTGMKEQAVVTNEMVDNPSITSITIGWRGKDDVFADERDGQTMRTKRKKKLVKLGKKLKRTQTKLGMTLKRRPVRPKKQRERPGRRRLSISGERDKDVLNTLDTSRSPVTILRFTFLPVTVTRAAQSVSLPVMDKRASGYHLIKALTSHLDLASPLLVPTLLLPTLLLALPPRMVSDNASANGELIGEEPMNWQR